MEFDSEIIEKYLNTMGHWTVKKWYKHQSEWRIEAKGDTILWYFANQTDR